MSAEVALVSLVLGQGEIKIGSCPGAVYCEQRRCQIKAVSFPTTSNPIVYAYQLFNSVPGATAVVKMHKNPSNIDCPVYEWNGSLCRGFQDESRTIPCNSGTLPPGTVPENPIPAIEFDKCFKVNPGDGLWIETDKPLEPFNAYGIDGPNGLTLYGPNIPNLISLPYRSPLATARYLFNSIPSATSACRVNCNATRDCWLGDFTGTSNFPLVHGEAYLVEISGTGVGISLANNGSSGPPACDHSNGYKITGSGNATHYAWGVDADNSMTGMEAWNLDAATDHGDTACNLATKFATNINVISTTTIGAQVNPTLPCDSSEGNVCVTSIVATASGAPHLYINASAHPSSVGPITYGSTSADEPDCDPFVGTGCTYNPLITLSPSEILTHTATAVPVTSRIAFLILFSAILFTGAKVLFRGRG